MKFAAIYVPFNIVMSLLLALLLHHATFASGFFRTVFYLPSVISGGCACDDLELDLQQGIRAAELHAVARRHRWTELARRSQPGPRRHHRRKPLGPRRTMLILLTGLKAIPKELYEAATVSGVPAGRRCCSSPCRCSGRC